MSAPPKGWQLIELDALKARGGSSLVGGPFGSDLTQRDYVGEPGVPVIRGSNLDGKNNRFIDDGFVYVSARKALQLSKNLAFPGDLIFTQRGTLGQVAVIPHAARFDRYVISQSQMKLTPDQTIVDRHYLYHYFRAPRTIAKLLSETQATGVPHINLGILKRFRVLLPPLAEQRRIAEILDTADALRTKRRAALAKLDTLTQSIFIDMFGDPAGNPRKLPQMCLREITTVATGGTPRRDVDDFFGGDVPWVKTTEINGDVIVDTEEKLTGAGLRAIGGKVHPVGSVVVAMYGQGKTRGKSALLGIAAAVNQACAVIRPNSSFVSHFMLTQLRLGYERLRAAARGGNQENLNLDLIGSFRVLLPPMSLQETFLGRIERNRQIQAAAAASLASFDFLFASLQHRAFRGEL